MEKFFSFIKMCLSAFLESDISHPIFEVKITITSYKPTKTRYEYSNDGSKEFSLTFTENDLKEVFNGI